MDNMNTGKRFQVIIIVFNYIVRNAPNLRYRNVDTKSTNDHKYHCRARVTALRQIPCIPDNTIETDSLGVRYSHLSDAIWSPIRTTYCGPVTVPLRMDPCHHEPLLLATIYLFLMEVLLHFSDVPCIDALHRLR